MSTRKRRSSSPTRQRERNQERVLQALSERGALSLDELIEATGRDGAAPLARGTVHAAVRGDGPLGPVLAPPREVRLTHGPGGRPTSYFSLKPYVAVGADFDRDRVRVCITDLRGRSLWREHVRLRVDGDSMQLWTKNSRGEFRRNDSERRSQEDILLKRLAPTANPGKGRTSGAVDNHPGFALQAAVDLVEKGLKQLADVPPPFWPDENHVAAQRGLLNRSEPLTRDHILGIGVAMPAPVDLETGTASTTVLPGWAGIKPAEVLRDALGLNHRVRLVIGNDANLGAWAEYAYASRPDSRYGFAEPPRSLLYIKIAPGPRGLGAGVVAQDSSGRASIFRGANLAGELGHTLLEWHADQPGEEAFREDKDENKCPHCGRTSCVESLVALPIFLRDEGHQSHETWDDVVSYLRQLEPSKRRATPEAKAIIEASKRLGKALGTAVTLFNPDLVVIAGPLSHVLADPHALEEYGDVSILRDDEEQPLLTELEAAAFPDAFASLKKGHSPAAVFRSGLGWWGIALGAALRVLDFDTRQAPFFRDVIDSAPTVASSTAP
jgi:predicted NBD/HSP70 family sugar kinase